MSQALEALFELRVAAENAAATDLAEAQRLRAAADAALAVLENEAARARQALTGEERVAAAALPRTAGDALVRERFSARLRDEARACEARVDQQRRGACAVMAAAERAAHEAWVQAHQEREALAKVIARQADEAKRTSDRRADDDAHDVALGRWRRER